MLSVFDPFRGLDFASLILRIVCAFVCGSAVGLERSFKNKPAGLRSHILVCMGASMASVTGLYLWLYAHIPTDISRIPAQVVSGLGFIGGGTIIVVNNNKIKGLNTASGLWVSGIAGLASGAGFYEGALLVSALAVMTEIIFSPVSRKIRKSSEFSFSVSYREKTALNYVLRYCRDNNLYISDLRVKHSEDIFSADISVQSFYTYNHGEFIEKIGGLSGVTSAESK